MKMENKCFVHNIKSTDIRHRQTEIVRQMQEQKLLTLYIKVLCDLFLMLTMLLYTDILQNIFCFDEPMRLSCRMHCLWDSLGGL